MRCLQEVSPIKSEQPQQQPNNQHSRHAKRQRLDTEQTVTPANAVHSSSLPHVLPAALWAESRQEEQSDKPLEPLSNAAISKPSANAPVTPKLEDLAGAVPSNSVPGDSSRPSADAAHTAVHIAPKPEPQQLNKVAGTADNHLKVAAAATQFRGNVKRIRDAESFQRQQERRQKKAAFLLDGTTTGPVVGTAKGGSWGYAAQQHAVKMQNGQLIRLPVRPNRCFKSCSFHVIAFA